MNILVTGGTGFIGQKLCLSLLDSGHTLSVLTRNPDKLKVSFKNQITPLTNLKNLKTSDHFDVIINLTGAPIFGRHWSEKQKQILLDSRIIITKELVEFINRSQKKPEVFLSGSAIGIYGNQNDTVLDESSTISETQNLTLKQKSTPIEFSQKLCQRWEEEALKAQLYGVRTCILRTGLVLGKDGGLLQSMLLPFKLGMGVRFGSGAQWMSWIHIEDYISICQLLLQKNNLSGYFNMTAPNPVTNKIFTHFLAKICNRPSFLIAPEWSLKTILGEMSEMLLDSQRVLPKRILEVGFRFEFEDLESALKDILS